MTRVGREAAEKVVQLNLKISKKFQRKTLQINTTFENRISYMCFWACTVSFNNI